MGRLGDWKIVRFGDLEIKDWAIGKNGELGKLED